MGEILSIVMGVINFLLGRQRDAHDLEQKEIGADKQHSADLQKELTVEQQMLAASQNNLTGADLDNKLKNGEV